MDSNIKQLDKRILEKAIIKVMEVGTAGKLDVI